MSIKILGYCRDPFAWEHARSSTAEGGSTEIFQSMKSVSEMSSSALSAVRHVILFSDYLTKVELASALLYFKNACSEAHIWFLEVSHLSVLSCFDALNRSHVPMRLVLQDSNLASIIAAVAGADEREARRKLSRSQEDLFRQVALGRSNLEIAQMKNCSVRAVEALLNRAWSNLGLNPNASKRQRTVVIAKLFP